MYLRPNVRKKNGKEHRYFSVVEKRRLAHGKYTDRQVLYLGEINDSQEAAWRKTLQVFDARRERSETLALFPQDRELPPDALNAIQVKLDEMQLRRPRCLGNCWLGQLVWRELGLDRFWDEKLREQRGEVPWAKVLELLVINRLLEPGSEFRLHRQWFDRSAMDELLGSDFAVASKDRLYRCLDLVLAHKDAMFQHLKQRWRDLFSANFDVLLYDLTSSYFEGLCELIPKARHGYSRDGRPDCRQVVIGLVVTPDGLPLAYEVLPGNTSDKTTLRSFLRLIEARYGKAGRVWVRDRGIPTEEVLAEMRQEGVQYLVGTPKGRLTRLEKSFLPRPWQEVRAGVRVKLLDESGELGVLARSDARVQKERAMRLRRLRKLYAGLREVLRQAPERDKLLQKLGALKHDAGRAANLVEIVVPRAGELVTPETFRWKLRWAKFKALARRDGHYILRTNLRGEDPAVLWQRYVELTEIEAAFKNLKSDLALRPFHHQLEQRVEAHTFVAFLGDCLVASLRQRLRVHAPGLTPKAVWEKLATIQMLDVWLPTTDGRWLVLPRYTQPQEEHQLVLEKLKLELPAQPPPRSHSGQVCPPARPAK